MTEREVDGLIELLMGLGVRPLYQRRRRPTQGTERHMLSSIPPERRAQVSEVLTPLGWAWDDYGDLFYLDDPADPVAL